MSEQVGQTGQDVGHVRMEEAAFAQGVTFGIQFYSGQELVKVDANLENLAKAVVAIGAHHRIISVVVDDGIEGPVWYHHVDERTGISFRWCPRAGCGDIQVLNAKYEQLASTFEELAWHLRDYGGDELVQEKRLFAESREKRG